MESQLLNNLPYVNIDGRVLHYKCLSNIGEYGESHWTEFYEGTEKKYHRKYFFFGEKIETEKPKLIFTIYEDCNCVKRTKGWWRERIIHHLELLNRSEELKRGELI